jgi:hypothetical protein
MIPGTFTIAELVAIEIGGQKYSRPHIKKVIEYGGVLPVDRYGNSKIYKLTDVEEAFRKYRTEEATKKTSRYHADDEVADLRKQKLAKEVEVLSKDIQRRDLQIEQLKNTLIDKDEVRDFLVVHQGIENALLRRLLFVQLPIEIPGLTIPKAREKAESYYNTMMEALNKTLDLWNNKYDLANNINLEHAIRNIVKAINNPSGSYAPPVTGSCSGSLTPNQSENR